MTEYNNTAVFDFGSYSAQSGIDGEDAPQFVVSAITDEVGEPVDVFNLNSNDKSTRPTSLDDLFRPIQHGMIEDRERLSALYSFCFRKLKSETDLPTGALVDLPPLVSRADREFLSEFFFEEMGLAQLFQEASGVLATYSCGITTAMTLCSGDGYSSSMMLLLGESFPNTTNQVPFAGNLVNMQLASLNQQMSPSSGTKLDFKRDELSIYNLKHSACYLSEDLENELEVSQYSSSLSMKHTLPDGSSIRVQNERFMAAEALFLPQRSSLYYDKIFPGIAEMISDTARRAPIDHRAYCYDNLVLSGGNTFIPGFADRLKKELRSHVNSNVSVKIVAPPERKFSEWIGGSILASLSSFQHFVITKEMYDESGPRCIYKLKNSFLNTEGARDLLLIDEIMIQNG